MSRGGLPKRSKRKTSQEENVKKAKEENIEKKNAESKAFKSEALGSVSRCQ
jgi:hypothetical protein